MWMCNAIAHFDKTRGILFAKSKSRERARTLASARKAKSMAQRQLADTSNIQRNIIISICARAVVHVHDCNCPDFIYDLPHIKASIVSFNSFSFGRSVGATKTNDIKIYEPSEWCSCLDFNTKMNRFFFFAVSLERNIEFNGLFTSVCVTRWLMSFKIEMAECNTDSRLIVGHYAAFGSAVAAAPIDTGTLRRHYSILSAARKWHTFGTAHEYTKSTTRRRSNKDEAKIWNVKWSRWPPTQYKSLHGRVAVCRTSKKEIEKS